ncbi:hypothetical protein JCM9279_003804 [Rhodotorula babjevae]
MSSPPAYAALAAHDTDTRSSFCTAPAPLSHKLANEAARCDTDRSTSTSNKELDEHAFYTADQPSRRAAARAAVATSVVALVALGVVGFALCGGGEGVAALGRAVGCSGRSAQQQQQRGGGEGQHQWARRQVDVGDDSATGKEEFSTTTYLGDVTTYVKTTRPIVNPGGYTFGTLTGYVPVPTTTASAVNASSSPSASLEPSSTATFSRSVTSLPAAPSSASAAPSSSSAHDEREPWASRDADAAESSSPAGSPTSVATPATRRLVKRDAEPEAEPAWDFAAVDAHLLHRRGEDFEAAEVGSSSVVNEATATVTGKEEFSTSTNRQGGVVTLVKTTRPIVNPGGYVIGTLDGAWVDVARQTDRTTLPPAPTSTVAASSSSTAAGAAASSAAPASRIDDAALEPTTTSTPAPAQAPAHKRAHDELRRRNVVELA